MGCIYRRGRIWWVKLGKSRESTGTSDKEKAKTYLANREREEDPITEADWRARYETASIEGKIALLKLKLMMKRRGEV